MMPRYEQIDHTGDIGILVYGKSIEEIYENAGYAYFDIICNLEEVREKEIVEVEAAGESPEKILRNFLVKLLILSQVEEMLLSSFEVHKISDSKILAKCKGEKFSESRHTIHLEIKAVTYHMLEVRQKEDGTWQACVIFDI